MMPILLAINLCAESFHTIKAIIFLKMASVVIMNSVDASLPTLYYVISVIIDYFAHYKRRCGVLNCLPLKTTATQLQLTSAPLMVMHASYGLINNVMHFLAANLKTSIDK